MNSIYKGKLDEDDPRNVDLDAPFKDRVQQLVRMHGCPLDELFRIGMDLNADNNLRISALKEAAAYAYAKRKAIEVSGPDGAPLEAKIDVSKLSDKELELLLKLTKKASAE
jgi:hypothetical protein